MSEYAGSSLVISWLQAAATTVLSGAHKSLTYTPSINFYDATSGADANKSYIAGVKDGTATFNANLLAGSVAGGTVTYAVVVEGAAGTLQIQPEGTAASKPKISIPALAQGAQFSFPYDNIVEVTVNFQQNGARVDAAN